MKAVLCLIAVLGAGAALADSTAPPDGWTLNGDGVYSHSQSGVVCAKTVGTYNFVRLDGPSEPNILGVCVYSGGDLRIGEIRVRKFIDGVGETPLAIQNDRSLMGLVPMTGAPPGAKPLGAQRIGPGPMIDGNETRQSVVTTVRGGLLMDCISLTRTDLGEMQDAFKNFETACSFPGQ
jgi:hypothetical protein